MLFLCIKKLPGELLMRVLNAESLKGHALGPSCLYANIMATCVCYNE
jgi:hypothetical protein